MTNTIVRRALQLFGRKFKVQVRVKFVRGESEPIVVGAGWAVIEAMNVDLERVPDWHGASSCPECQQKPVTCVWEMWGKNTENDHRHINYLWCSNDHMWITTESHHDQLVSGQWG